MKPFVSPSLCQQQWLIHHLKLVHSWDSTWDSLSYGSRLTNGGYRFSSHVHGLAHDFACLHVGGLASLSRACLNLHRTCVHGPRGPTHCLVQSSSSTCVAGLWVVTVVSSVHRQANPHWLHAMSLSWAAYIAIFSFYSLARGIILIIFLPITALARSLQPELLWCHIATKFCTHLNQSCASLVPKNLCIFAAKKNIYNFLLFSYSTVHPWEQMVLCTKRWPHCSEIP